MTLAADLAAARASTAAIVGTARDDTAALRRELADRHAVIAEAAQAHRTAALELDRSQRGRPLVTLEHRGPVPAGVRLVAYAEPVAAPYTSRAGPPLRWHLLAGILTSWLLCGSALAAPSPALRAALAGAHRDVFGVAPSVERLDVAYAHTALESGHGRRTCGGNVGGIMAGRGAAWCRYGRARLASYTSMRASARAYWRLRAVRRALPWFDRGDPAGAAWALRRAHYYTAPGEGYAAAMVAIYAAGKVKR